MLNADEYLVTLFSATRVHAQARFPRNAFRLLFLLLMVPYGASYAELLACLHCSEPVFHQMLIVSSREEVFSILAPQRDYWQRHLSDLTREDAAILERNLKMVRRAVKERNGINSLLQRHGFALRVSVLHGKGYVLLRDRPEIHSRESL
ncbi:hypothetical protein KSX_09460 [Ktedonospora formicarum]|uniref:Uncharacterized protein n=2 Tax=Ktedonospora formicarum TaxID=2778364 RepID=A0A8J3HYD0_9CHLR|nr:hypothetical protein KSX_09460 [Ktedonospora formicarum]